jgi:hypothetical protein
VLGDISSVLRGATVARLILEFPRRPAGTLEQLLSTFDGHRFVGMARRSAGTPAPTVATRLQDAYAREQLLAVGREAAISCATTGRARFRARPPCDGPETLRCAGIPLADGDDELLFVQQIVASESAPRDKPGISWWPVPVRPLFRSHAEAAGLVGRLSLWLGTPGHEAVVATWRARLGGLRQRWAVRPGHCQLSVSGSPVARTRLKQSAHSHATSFG